MPICTADNSTHKTPEALRKHLRAWMAANPESAKTWAIDYLRQRKVDKGLVYAPSQAELRTLYCPTMPYFESIGGYYEITRSLGFKDRYVKEPVYLTPLLRETRIVCDTREQRALALPYQTINEALNYGDYALAPPHDKGVRIERKGTSDLFGSLTSKKVKHKRIAEDSPCERFERELIRTQEAGGYIVMIVESTIKNTENHRDQTGFGKAGAAHIFKNLRDLLVKYPHTWQVLFADGRADAAAKLVRVFEMGEQVKRVDLQWAAEKGDI